LVIVQVIAEHEQTHLRPHEPLTWRTSAEYLLGWLFSQHGIEQPGYAQHIARPIPGSLRAELRVMLADDPVGTPPLISSCSATGKEQCGWNLGEVTDITESRDKVVNGGGHPAVIDDESDVIFGGEW
jgi:hypothetical protein